MKKYLWLLLTLPFLTGAAPTSTYRYVTGNVIVANEVQTETDNIYLYLQRGVDTYADGSITTDDIVDGTIVAADLSGTAAIPGSRLDLSVPGAIGGTTPAAGTFTTLTGTTINAFTLGGKLTAGSNEIEGSNFDITGGTITGITDLAVADGGTGKSSWTQYLLLYADTTTSLAQIAIGTSGQVLTSNGAGSAPSFQAASSTLKREVLTSGTSWTCPAGITMVYITAVGGGGGGGSGSGGTYGGGGGSGAYTIHSGIPVTPTTAYTYAIGAAGASASSGNSGGNGGNTTFTGDSSMAITCNGGSGGTGGGAGAGAGGTAVTQGNGILTFAGIAGMAGGASVGKGGSSIFGMGGNTSAQAASGYGAGGASEPNGNASGAGTQGIIIIEY